MTKHIFACALFLSSTLFAAGEKVFLTYHWHMHQPIYWPDRSPGLSRVQFAAESFDLKAAGKSFYPGSPVPHPQNNLATGDIGSYDPVFTHQDRVHAYQDGGRNSIATLNEFPDGGASISYTGSLMDNIWSWGKDNRFGYRPNWNQGYRQALQMKTSGGKPKGDLVGITYHHSLSPLLPKSVFRKELQLWKQAAKNNFSTRGAGGFFPPEAAFSETLIPVLVEEGFDWSIVSGVHLARTCENFLDKEVAPFPSTSTWNTNPPNRADRSGPRVPPKQWWSGTLDGRGAKLPAPFAYLPHYARHMDPETEKETKLVVVPLDDVQSYMNGYASMSTDRIDSFVAPFSEASRPSLVLMAHDGDNAWGGGASYYQESVPGLAREAARKGYRMSTIKQYLADHPVPSSDVVHVEDGGWINPEGDWGDPQFVKWLYPPARSPKDKGYDPQDPRTFIDIEGGFSSSWRSWAVITAGANICETAEQAAGASNENVKLAWHFYLAGLDSGFMYYGDSLDDPIKQSLAVNNAVGLAEKVISSGNDSTPPTIFRPQRWPHNPGGIGWGVTTGYRPVGFQGKPAHASDFYVWTLAYDVSGVKSATVKVRKSETTSVTDANRIYRGGEWISFPMSRRKIDPTFTGNPPNPKLNYFILPKVISDHYWAKVTGIDDTLVDYYVEMEDSAGNKSRSEISHVWVGPG